MPRFVEVKEELQGRPVSKVAKDMDTRTFVLSSPSGLPPLANKVLYFHNGLIDGGDIGEPDTAMDYLDTTLDGGTL